MVVLGARVAIVWTEKLVAAAVDEEKARRWLFDLVMSQTSKRCDADLVDSMAGRLNFAAGVAVGRVSRGFIRLFCAQANDPLPGFRTSPLLRQACAWWAQ